MREAGGVITAKNNPGGGATLRVVVPGSGRAAGQGRGVSAHEDLTVLVVDDELLIRKSLGKVLRARGYAVEVASTGAEGLESGVRLPAAGDDPRHAAARTRTGSRCCAGRGSSTRCCQVIVITAFGDVQSAVDAMKLGACDFSAQALRDGGHRARRRVRRPHISARRASWTSTAGRRGSTTPARRSSARSAPMRAVRELIEKVVRSQATSVLITGESGTGKELVARAIHYRSDRAQAPLMEVNCSSFHENLLENELFGHERGAFTDATDTKKGLVELCDGGTLFLDEVADMPLPTQAKLLRFIDHRNFKRVGGAQDIAVDIRIVAATNKDLEAEVRAGRFRSDLYFRLKVVSIHCRALRERGDDVLLLGPPLHARVRAQVPEGASPMIAPRPAQTGCVTYRWPGNVRELRNLIERVVLLEEGDELEAEHLPPELRTSVRGRAPRRRRSARAAADARADGGRAHQRGAASHRRQQESRGAHPRHLARRD